MLAASCDAIQLKKLRNEARRIMLPRHVLPPRGMPYDSRYERLETEYHVAGDIYRVISLASSQPMMPFNSRSEGINNRGKRSG
jgi:hypothetical protein